jgi:hypothetical protein
MENRIEKLKTQLHRKRARIEKRYVFYEMKNLARDFGISTPPELLFFNSVVGWSAKAVDSLADRLNFIDFKNDVFDFNQIFNFNNKDIFIRALILDALISSCSFIYISKDETGFPRLQCIPAEDATGEMDEITGLLKDGYAVLKRDEFKNPILEAYFTPDFTAYYENGKLIDSRTNNTGYTLLIPFVFRPDSKRPFGHSRISRACMGYTSGAMRTIKRSEISAEFFSFPQKYATGLDNNSETFDKWAAAMSAMLRFTLNEDGQDHVKVGQFVQQSFTPHIEELKMFASLFAGETGLTLDDLGFPQSNPSSSEAIKAAHENLRLCANGAMRTFNVGLLNAGFVGACVRDDMRYQRQQIHFERPSWMPSFPADVSTLGAVGDAVGKINTAFPEYFTAEKMFEITGI